MEIREELVESRSKAFLEARNDEAASRTRVEEIRRAWLSHGRHVSSLLEDLSLQIIQSFQGIKDCRLAPYLMGQIGSRSQIDQFILPYLEIACLGDGRVADQVARAVMMTPPRVRRFVHFETMFRLASAARQTSDDLSPVARVRRLLHAPTSDRSKLVNDEERELDILLEFPATHVAAMAEVFEHLSWNDSDGQTETLLPRWMVTRIEWRGLLALAQLMPVESTRQLLAEWYLFFDDVLPSGGAAAEGRSQVLETLGPECVPRLAAWMVWRLPEMARQASKADKKFLRQRHEGELRAALKYLSGCQPLDPPLQTSLARFRAMGPQTLLGRETERAFGSTVPAQERP